ncbi:hypothetical protein YASMINEVIRUS_955 [Yasminevirus sp. GU-2018]|uniref:Uncharacterized protein n=1 Tax=Yasminevirus sp. GU-2018 TaxID=2420051 RepID=A0A5K0UAH2_9VIRU|nr:hypothetical protein YASMINEVIRUS_955 [Yasminevirus sp. GU-2018]
MFDVLSNLLYTYFSLYKISLGVCGLFFWMCMSYVDRVHMRERSRRIGVRVHNIISKLTISKSVHDKLRILFLRPLCSLFETVTGFLEGVENFDPVISIASNALFDLSNSAETYSTVNSSNIEVDAEAYHLITTKGGYIGPDLTIDKIKKNPDSGEDTNPDDDKHTALLLRALENMKASDRVQTDTQSSRRVRIEEFNPKLVQKGSGSQITQNITQGTAIGTLSDKRAVKSDHSFIEESIDSRSDNRSDDSISNVSTNSKTSESTSESSSTSKSSSSTDLNLNKDSSPNTQCELDEKDDESDEESDDENSDELCANDKDSKTGVVKYVDSLNNDRMSYVRSTAYTQTVVQKQDDKSKGDKSDTYVQTDVHPKNNSKTDKKANKDNNDDDSDDDQHKKSVTNDDQEESITKRRKVPIKLARRRYQN